MNDIGKIGIIAYTFGSMSISYDKYCDYVLDELKDIEKRALSDNSMDVHREISDMVMSKDFVDKILDLQKKINETKELVDAYVDENGG